MTQNSNDLQNNADEIARLEAQLEEAKAKKLELVRVQAGNPSVGDRVLYYHEHYFGRVKEYPALIGAVYDDLRCDLMATMENGPVNIPQVRYDPDGKPSSWRPQQTAQ